MLRGFVLGLGVAMLVLAGVLAASGARAGALLPLFAWGVILAAGVAFERYRYKRELDQPPGEGWMRTGEKIVEADRVVTVWFNPATGERVYVRERA